MSFALTIERPAPGDIVILLMCLLLIPASLLATRGDESEATAVRITAPDQPPRSYPLHPNRRIEVEGRLGTSVIEIRDGRARFVSSPCSGQQCVLSGWHDHSGDGMVCLPNRVGMTLVGQQQRYDGMNF